MASRTSKASKTSTNTGATAGVGADGKIFVGKSDKPEYLTLKLANRHGLVTGATGTGKTVTLQVIAEGLSRAGVPVFAADIKGDLSGVAAIGEKKDFILARAKDVGVDYQPDQFPVIFWDLFGEQGHPIRATVSDGSALVRAHDAAQRHAGRRAQYRIPRRRRAGTLAS
jgi:hypothetical protein